MKLPFHIPLAMILALSVACQDGSSSKGNDDDSTGVTDDCYPGCTCYDGNYGGAHSCVDPAPRSRGDFPNEPVESVKAYYGSDDVGSDYLHFALTLITPRFQLDAFRFNVFIDQEKYNPDNLPHPAILLGSSKGILQENSGVQEMSKYSGCGGIRIDRLDYDWSTAKASYVKGAIVEANLCHAGTYMGMPKPHEQGLPQELHIDLFEFETDQLERTLDSGDFSD